MAVGKNKRLSKGGKRGSKKRSGDPMLRKEWYDVVAPSNFKSRQFAKTLCNKTIGIKLSADNLRGRVYEANLADLDQAMNKDQSFRKVKLQVMEVAGRNLLTQFHGMQMTTDKLRSLVRKWCTLIESVIEAKTTDGFTLRLFVTAFTTKQPGQLSKNCYAPTRLVKWVRYRMTRLVQKRLARCDLQRAVTLLTHDILADSLFRRCNPIMPLRDVKISKVKVIRTPKYDSSKLLDIHGGIPQSIEDQAPVVAEVAAVAEEE